MSLSRTLRTLCLALGLLVGSVGPAMAAQCAAPGRDGAGLALTGVVNSYFPGTASAAAGATTIALGAGAGSGNAIAVGDLLLVIQMQDATINAADTTAYGANNATGSGTTSLVSTGLYEFVRATSARTFGGTTSITIASGTGGGLVNSYSNANFVMTSTTRGQRRYQVIRVPQYATASLGAALSAMAWNGATGGVLSIDVAGTLNLNGGQATASGLGFRGGGGRGLAGAGGSTNAIYRTLSTVAQHSSKGEGIVGTPAHLNNQGALLSTTVEGYPNGSNGRGAPGNAGGGGNDGNPTNNDQNSGGGGGGGRGNGGKGGNTWSTQLTVGGVGGTGVVQAVNRLTPGGGGGAGATNNASGTPGAGFASSGAAGGGIVIIRSGTLAGSGSINVNGASANNTVLNDGSGGGGAGGSALIVARGVAAGAALTVSANGGTGGTNTGGGSPHGPGGGGGGGYVATSITASASVSGGAAGTTSGGVVFGAVSGAQGATQTVSAGSVVGISSGAECSPVITKDFDVATVGLNQTSRLTLTITNPNPTLALSAIAVTDSYPSGIRNAAAPATATTCTGATVTAAANGASLAVSGASLAAGASCTVSATVAGTQAGDQVNTIPAGDLDGVMGPTAVTSVATTQATLVVTPPLVASKSSTTASDPINNTTNPKAIPGSFVDFTIAVSNPSGRATDADTVFVSDAIPSGTQLFVGDLGAGGTGPVAFQQGSPTSTLTYSFSTLASTTDDLEFSNNDGASYVYAPTANPMGVDPAVTHVRISPTGTHAAGGQFSVRFRVRVP